MNPQTTNVQFNYDEKTDVLHATFGTGEPSYAEHLDDLVILELGFFSGTPTGFQLLHVREVGIKKVQIELRRMGKTLPRMVKLPSAAVVADRRHRIREALAHVEQQAKELVSG